MARLPLRFTFFGLLGIGGGGSICGCARLGFPGFRGTRLLHNDECAHVRQADLHRINGEDLDLALVVAPVVGI